MEFVDNDYYDDHIDITSYMDNEEDDDTFKITDSTEKTIILDDRIILTKISDSKWKVSDTDNPNEYYCEMTKSTNQKLADYKEK
ncbi:hypothetical protein AC622_01995 [Bacillus sp. FJAT-27916]|uniref:hypothetical protein n=1 Tax=Bacillus sp. FJAT-27916 TaxID=1679169 RepID=UPI000671133F|nr:hypothetical protein [Bacillus sp. FJAT-27916]KMY43177.1 hypothetical protein AC622_01995 [Bacillus sp. FJAT-27916]